MDSVDSAWTILEKAFGNPFTHLNFRLAIMKATQPLTDKVIENDTSRAAAWFLKYEKAVESILILRLGDRSATLGMQCFNATTNYKICERLPYSIQDQTYGLEEERRDNLKKVIEMISKARQIVGCLTDVVLF